MKSRLAMAAALFALGAAAYAHGKKEEVLKVADSIKYEAVPGVTGATKAELWGDPNKSHGGLTKFTPGFKVPMHSHSKDVKMIVISGTIVHTTADGKTVNLTPGSYLFVPGNVVHGTACAEGAECLFYEEQPGAFDLKPVEPKK